MFRAPSRHWGLQQRAKQTPLYALMELTFSGETTYRITQTHRDTPPGLTRLIRDSEQDPS